MGSDHSSKPQYSGNAIAARLGELHYGKPAIVVEGESDLGFWNIIRSSQAEVLPAYGRKAVIDGVRGFQNKSVGVIDEDYERIGGGSSGSESENLFSTKEPNDIESLLLQSWLMGGADSIPNSPDYMFQAHIPRNLVQKAVVLSRGVGVLRAINHSEGWGLRFKSEDRFMPPWLEGYVKSDEDERERALISGVKNNSTSTAPGIEEIQSRYREGVIRFRGASDFALTNGHDLSKIIEILSAGAVRSMEVEKWLRNEVRPRGSDFELFRKMNRWSEKNGLPLIILKD